MARQRRATGPIFSDAMDGRHEKFTSFILIPGLPDPYSFDALRRPNS